jgi:hypothetical protein
MQRSREAKEAHSRDGFYVTPGRSGKLCHSYITAPANVCLNRRWSLIRNLVHILQTAAKRAAIGTHRVEDRRL